MKYYIITDTHFNHTEKMTEYCKRPKDYNELIWKGLDTLNHTDVLIHLGDICIGNDAEIHGHLQYMTFKKILIRGNHDKKSNSWYLEHGWDFVCEQFMNTYFGKKILFSHFPIEDCGYDINIHGHFHNSDHRRHEPELVAVKNDKQKLLVLEDVNYKPVNLEKFI